MEQKDTGALPRIAFHRHTNLHIEVMNIEELFHKLKNSDSHDPFAPHIIEFYFILVITDKSYTHLVDFNAHELKRGSAIFVAQSQLHQFTEELRFAEGYGIVFNNLFVDKHYLLTENVRL
ncbi:MAG: AraC family transcriptional regulator, partial [Bacteroidota bacterium]